MKQLHILSVTIFIPPIAPQITLIYHLGLYNRPEVAAVPGDVSATPQKKS
jgi:hypothetical protein